MTYPWEKPRRIDIVMPTVSRSHTPSNTPEPEYMLLVSLYTVAAFLYVIGWPAIFPRTHRHDAVVILGFCLATIVWRLWQHVERISLVLYYLPAMTLAAAPFVLDLYLMYGR